MNHRLDTAHPQAAPLPRRIPESLLPDLVSQLQDEDISYAKLIAQLEPYPLVIRRILQAANSVTLGKWQSTTSPVQAASYMGTRRLVNILQNVYAETFGAEMLQRADIEM